MSFKIVLCEDGGIVAIPEGWEANNILYWPPLSGRALEKLRSNPYSKSEWNWKTEKCSLKKYDIQTFREAIRFEEEFEKIGTDDEENLLRLNEQVPSGRFRTCKYNSTSTAEIHVQSSSKYNDMFQNSEPPSSAEQNAVHSALTDNPSNPLIKEDIMETENESYQIITAVQDEETKAEIRSLDVKLNNMKEFFMIEFAKVNAKCDEIIKTLKSLNTAATSSPNPIIDSDLNLQIVLPLTTVKEVEDLEEKLLDETFRNHMIRKLINIGGNCGTGDWSKIAYKLMYELFTHELLNSFSWTGILKSNVQKSEPKLAFLKYSKVIELFYEVVKLGDNNFTKTLSEKFLKSGLRNAKLRLDRHNKKKTLHDAPTSEQCKDKTDEQNHNNEKEIDSISVCEAVDDGLLEDK